jgi:hypothetical protein
VCPPTGDRCAGRHELVARAGRPVPPAHGTAIRANGRTGASFGAYLVSEQKKQGRNGDPA